MWNRQGSSMIGCISIRYQTSAARKGKKEQITLRIKGSKKTCFSQLVQLVVILAEYVINRKID